MKATTLPYMVLALLLPILSGAKEHNYKYIYKSSCNCILSKDNPKGMEHVSIATYETDPDVHHIVGYYASTSASPVDTFSLTDFSPKKMQCYPCMVMSPGTKYVFYFPGKDDMDQAELKLHKEEKGGIVIDK